MTIPLRNLPIIQNWGCHNCGDCCRSLEAVITDEEKQRIEALDLKGDAEIGAEPWIIGKGWRPTTWTLRRRPDGSCVFLTSANRCRLHERFGPEAKPFVCRLFPFVLVPAGNHWRVGMRYACPSAVANQGRPIHEHERDLIQLSRLLETHTGRTGDSAPAPPLQTGQQVPWSDLLYFARALVEIVEDRGDRMERRLRKCLALANLCRKARFDKVTGARLGEFLHVLGGGLDAEVARNPMDVPPPTWIGRVLFRTLLAVYARKDLGPHRGLATRGGLNRVLSGWRFVRGKGKVPRVNNFLADVTFEDVDKRAGFGLEVDDLFERYYSIKLQSLQFCGPSNFEANFWAGLESLLLTFPMILWLARAMGEQPPLSAVEKAIMLVDDHFGGNPILGASHNRFMLRTLGERGELARLVAWYGRN